MKNPLISFLFPEKCFVCNSSGSYLCLNCQKKLPKIKFQQCPCCGVYSKTGQTHPDCANGGFLNGSVSLFKYSPDIKKIIRGLKQELVKDSDVCLSDWLSKEISEQKAFKSWQKEGYIFIPVPLHKIRERWRGFNQSAVLLKQVCKKLDLPYREDLLERVRQTKDQTKLRAKLRKENMENAFRVIKGKEKLVKGKSFLLLDDVRTTGATLEECAKALKLSGAKSVWGLTLAK